MGGEEKQNISIKKTKCMKSTIIYLLYVKEYFSLDYQIPPPDPDPSIEGSPISDHSQIVFFLQQYIRLSLFSLEAQIKAKIK